jgi:hypothetical protein
MDWTLKGAHLLLQRRTNVLNNELDDLFRRCYPKSGQSLNFRLQSGRWLDRRLNADLLLLCDSCPIDAAKTLRLYREYAGAAWLNREMSVDRRRIPDTSP